MLLPVNRQADNYCERQRFAVLGSACARARQLFVGAPRPTTCKHQVEEDEAEQYGELTAVDGRREALRRMRHTSVEPTGTVTVSHEDRVAELAERLAAIDAGLTSQPSRH